MLWPQKIETFKRVSDCEGHSLSPFWLILNTFIWAWSCHPFMRLSVLVQLKARLHTPQLFQWHSSSRILEISNVISRSTQPQVFCLEYSVYRFASRTFEKLGTSWEPIMIRCVVSLITNRYQKRWIFRSTSTYWPTQHQTRFVKQLHHGWRSGVIVFSGGPGCDRALE